MEKIIEMTLDGRLTLVLTGLAFIAIAIIIEVAIYIDFKLARKRFLRKHYPNTHKWLK